MTTSTDPRFEVIAALIGQVKPSLRQQAIRPDDRLTDDLGLDSLDLLQLSRTIVRRLDPEFDLEIWEEGRPVHHGTVGSLVDCIGNTGDGDRSSAPGPV